jgi:serine/threonine protein kinase
MAVIEPLTDFVPLTINLRAFDKVKRIARLFFSLHRALQRLNKFYSNLDLDLDLTQPEQRFFPYIRKYKSNGANISFTYICELSDHNRTIWKAKRDDNGGLIVVKFTPEYCIEAHKLLQDCGFAPKLIYYSPDDEMEKFGGFRMIIMEYIDGISLAEGSIKNAIKPNSLQLIYVDLKYAIEVLHDNNYVFADLRAPNVMIFDEDDDQHAMLIDFDWCGKHNVDKYPSSMNKELPWPTGAEPGALLKKEHDLYWLNLLDQDFFRYVLFLSFNKLCIILTLFTFFQHATRKYIFCINFLHLEI